MEIKILRVYERNNTLRVETETEYGKDNLGLSLQQLYKDPITNEPRWKAEVKKLLEAKYLSENAIEKDIDKDHWDKDINDKNWSGKEVVVKKMEVDNSAD